MRSSLPQPPDPEVADHPEPLPPARGRGFLAERLLSINSLVSLTMLTWSVAVWRRPALLRRALQAAHRYVPWLVGGKDSRTSRGADRWPR